VIRAVVFDLDGTLADTSTLGNGRRMPAQVLHGGVNNKGFDVSHRWWGWTRRVSDIPAILIERGYFVAVATRAPLAYASTLLHLIDVDYQILKSSCGAGLAKSETLVKLCSEFGISPQEMIYCGDLPEDRDIAAEAGVSFLDATDFRDHAALEKFPRLLNGRGDEVEIEGLPLESPSSAGEHFLLFDYVSHLKVGSLSQSDVKLLDGYLDRVESSMESSETRAAISANLLLNFPSLPCRRNLQRELFLNVGPMDRDAILSSSDTIRFGLNPRIITRRELRVDTPLRDEYLSALHRVWPSLQGDIVPGLFAAACFDGDIAYFGKVLGGAKDYRKHGASDGRLRSGPEVLLERVDFVSDLIASRLDPQEKRPLVPVPASAYSERQPGQFSIRVARRVADISQRKLLPILQRVDDDYVVNLESVSFRPWAVDLIEDQVTTGGTVTECREALDRAGIRVIGVYCYSANLRVLSNFARPKSVTIESRIQELLEEHWGH
jgi:hypothetical protein